MKKIVSFTLAVSMVVSLANSYTLQQKAYAATSDWTNIFAQYEEIGSNSTKENEGLLTDEYTIDGVSYNDITNYSGVILTASSQMQTTDYAIDNDNNTRWETNHGSDSEYLTADFGNIYSVKAILIKWENASAKKYTIQGSKNGADFEDITTVTASSGGRIDKIVFSEGFDDVRAVRVKCEERTTVYGYSIYEIGIYSKDEGKERIPIVTNLKVKDYSAYTGRYMVYFDNDKDISKYNLYVDGRYIKSVSGSGYCLTAKELEEFASGKHTISVASVGEDGTESPKASSDFTITGKLGEFTDMPQIYISTDTAITTDYHGVADVTVSVFDVENGEDDVVDSQCNIKIRGNSTAGFVKKPWNIKLNKKKSLLGLEKGKKWCLLANAFDRSCMRNKLAYDLGLEAGVTYTSESRFVEVYVNGVYNGTYQLTEPVEAKEGRVEIDAYEAENNDILLELGTRYEQGVVHFQTDVLKVTFDVNEPEKGDDLSDAEVDAKIARVKNYLNQFETALKSQNYEEIAKYIDEDTFINFYIVNELFKNQDFNFSSTRFYIKGDKLYAGPMWDLDLSSGNVKTSYYGEAARATSGYKCQEMVWYNQLMKNTVFANKVKARYKELQYTIQSIYKEGSVRTNSIDAILEKYERAFRSNFSSKDKLGAGWEYTTDDGLSYAGESGWTDLSQPVEYLRNWLKERNEWLCAQWGIDDIDKAYKETIIPTEVVGVKVIQHQNKKISIEWGTTPEQSAIGQSYNVYIDGIYYQTYTGATRCEYVFEEYGQHIIKVTGRYASEFGIKETQGVEVTIDVPQPETSTSQEATQPEISTIPNETTEYETITSDTNQEESSSADETTSTEKSLDNATIKKNEIAINAKLKISQVYSRVDIKWGKVKNADGYDVYGGYCGPKKVKLLKSIKKGYITKASIKRMQGKKIDLRKSYKYYVVAYKYVNGKKVTLAKTLIGHIVGKKNTKYTNVKRIVLNKSTYVLKKGGKAKIKARTVLVDNNKKALTNAHAKEFRYRTANNRIATVSANGTIKAKAKGNAKIYVYARNGYAKIVHVKIK